MTMTEPAAAREGMRGLKGKNVLVTGGTSGIGQAIAVRFAEHGANVAINYVRTPDEAAETEEQVHACALKVRQEGVRDILVGADVSDEAEVARMVAQTVEDLGGVDVLVNNAGYDNEQSLDDTTGEEWDKVIDLNVRSLFQMCQAASPYLRDGGGKVINVASMFGHVAAREELAYVTSKHAVMGMTKALALEWARSGVQVNALCPGFVATEMLARAMADEASAKYLRRMTPIGRWAEPEEMVGPALFLASDASSFMTGQILVVDGGWMA